MRLLRCRPVAALAWLILTGLVSGCATGRSLVTSPAAPTWTGESSRVQVGSYEQVWQAALAALDGMQIAVIDARRDALGGQVSARRSSDSAEVILKIEPVERSLTRVKVRVGPSGDAPASEQIQQDIESRLRS